MRRLYYILGVLVVLCALGFGWHFFQKSNQQPKRLRVQAQAVQVAKVVSMLVPSHAVSVGVLEAKQQINVSPEMDGKVVSIHYLPGTFVPKDKILIQLDDRIYKDNLRSALAALYLARINYQRTLKLSKLQAVAQQLLDENRATYQEAQAKVNSARTMLSETQIRASFSGYVGAKTISVGDFVKQGQVLTTLTNRQWLQVSYSLPEQYLPQLQLGQPVRITLSDQTGRQHFLGKVSYIAPTINVATHSVNLQADVPNKDNQLSPGLFVHVRQDIGRRMNSLMVPQQAIVPTITGAQVFVVRDGKAYVVTVKVGSTYKNRVQILSGLKANDTVVTAGQQSLKNGSPVRQVVGH